MGAVETGRDDFDAGNLSPVDNWSAETYSTTTFQSLPFQIRRVALFVMGASLVAVLAIVILIAHPWSGGGDGSSAGYTGSGSGVPGDTDVPQEPVSSDAPSEDPSPAATDGPSQAAALQGLLQQAITDHQTVISAVQDIQACGSGDGFDADISALTQAGTDRSEIADQVGQASVDRLSGGQEAAQALVTALTESAAADNAFAAWGRDVSNGQCDGQAPTGGRNYKDGESASTRAGKAKEEFVSLWNPIAGEYDLQTITSDDF
ncbi:hypothetical protein [Actinoallomurus bryophytorum]|uniref:hypothetical protein n=1 Tax=Actinoallomurus bryophytorum TaxID=1490222 RepID=UPI00114F84D0|nr:hypothetical protein [Actinoallomurus bryophytorum]